MANNNEHEDSPQMLEVVERNINSLLNRKKDEYNKRSLIVKIVDALANFASSIISVYFHFIFFGLWIIWNLGWINLKPFDPHFIFLVIFAALETIFLSSFVLISQKLANIEADKRAELDLQIGLLTEHEVTRMMNLVTAIAKKLNIDEAHDKEIEALSKDISPEKVLDSLDGTLD